MIGEKEFKNERVMQACLIAALANRLGYEVLLNLDKPQGYLEIFFDKKEQKGKIWLFLKGYCEFSGDIELFDKETEYDGFIEKPHYLIEIY